MSKGHAALKFLRKVHLYIGIFTTPALLFFAITGALQTFSLHETTQGSNYKPPAWIASLAQLHKKQTTVVPVRRPRLAAPENVQRDPQGGEPSHGGTERKVGGARDGSKPRGSAASEAAPSAQAQAEALRPSKAAEPAPAPPKSHLPMKIFFLLVSVSLLLSTLTGIYLSYQYSRGWWTVTGLLAAGVIVPLLLLPF